MAKMTALEGHRRDLYVPLHEHAGLCAHKGWAEDAEVTHGQYRSALRSWRKSPVSGVRDPAPPKPAPAPAPEDDPAPAPAGGS